MGFRKIVERDGSGTVTLDKQYLRLDGVIDDDGNFTEKEVHVQRLARGAYIVRAVENGQVPALEELVPAR